MKSGYKPALLALVYLLLVIMGCIPKSPVSCVQIEDPRLLELDFTQQNPERMIRWVRATYGIEATDILSGSYQNQAHLTPLTTSIGWASNHILYRAHFIEEQLIRITTEWEEIRPTADEVERCLGAPELYVARYYAGIESNELQFDLWYPSRGLIVLSGISSRSAEPPRNLQESSVYRLIYTQTGDVQNVMQNAFIDSSQDNKTMWLKSLRPWVESWGDIMVDDYVP